MSSYLHSHETWTHHSGYDITLYTSHLSFLSPLSQASYYILRQGVQWPWLPGQTFSHQRTKQAYNPVREPAGSLNSSSIPVGSPSNWGCWEHLLPGRQPELWRASQTFPEVESPTRTILQKLLWTFPGDIMGRILKITVLTGELSNITKHFNSKPSDQK